MTRAKEIIDEQPFLTYGLVACHKTLGPYIMPVYHRHNEVELNILEAGGITYWYGGLRWRPPLRRLCVFWAGRPHQIIQCEEDTSFYVIHLPLGFFLSWGLQRSFSDGLLSGVPVVGPESDGALHDLDIFKRWLEDLGPWHLARDKIGTDEYRIVLLELEARMRRLARTSKKLTRPNFLGPNDGDSKQDNKMDKIERMASFIAAHYTGPLTVAEIADSAGLNSNYAISLFRRFCQTTPMKYVLEQRIAHAQFLLLTTQASVIDIALSSGFGSLTRFYRAFKKVVGYSPREYRKSVL